MKKKLSFLSMIEIITVIMFILSLIPILGVSFFSHPIYDDFSYSKYVHDAILGTEPSFFHMIAAACREVKESYFTWQGTFSAIFLFAFQPGVYRIPCYWLTAFIIIGSLVFSSVYLWTVLTKTVFRTTKKIGIIIALILLEMQIQFVPDIKEAFFWYNGSVYYTFFFSVFLLEIALLLKLWNRDGFQGIVICTVSLLAFVIGGGNYSTALINTIILFTCLILSLLCKHGIFPFLLPLILHTTAFVISITAPGNSVRAAGIHGLPALTAILKSLNYAWFSLRHWTRLPQIGCFLLLILLFYYVIKDSSFTFRYPLIVILFLFGIFAAQVTPPLYAMSSEGGYRQIDMYYYSYYWMMALSILYVEGWFIQKWQGSRILRFLIQPFTGKTIVVLSFLMITVGACLYGLKNITISQTFLDLKSGRAMRYDQEYKRIISEIEASDGIVYTTDINEWPSSFHRLGLAKEDDIAYWINTAMASYYGVDKIILKD